MQARTLWGWTKSKQKGKTFETSPLADYLYKQTLKRKSGEEKVQLHKGVGMG